MTKLEFIRRYSKPFPLIGDRVNNCLAYIFDKLDKGSRGHIIYIEGEGGTGKSEIFEQIRAYFGYSVMTSSDASTTPKTGGAAPTRPRRAKINASNSVLFGGIIDLYNPVTYADRGIETALKEEWCQYFADNEDEFIAAAPALFRDGTKKPAARFKGYTDELESYRKFRDASPAISSTAALVSNRRTSLDETFLIALGDLANPFVPVLCFDTAELLKSDATSPTDLSAGNDALAWLYEFIKKPAAASCVIIIAGRPDDEFVAYEGGQKQKALDFWRTQSKRKTTDPKTTLQFKEFPLGGRKTDKMGYSLSHSEIQQYIYWYYKNPDTPDDDTSTVHNIVAPAVATQKLDVSSNPADPDAVPRQKLDASSVSEATTKEDLEQLGHTHWDAIARIIIDDKAVPANTPISGVLPIIVNLTRGKPLMVDWLCQILFKNILGKILIPGADETDNDTAEEKFRQGVYKLLGGDRVLMRRRMATLQQQQQVLRYAYIARRGIDADVVVWLSKRLTLKNVDFNVELSLDEAQATLKALENNPFLKIRFQKDSKRFFLHDEVYNSFVYHIEQVLGNDGQFNLSAIADELAYGYSSDPTFPHSTRTLDHEIDDAKQTQLVFDSA